jgi:hypothetical protein
MNKATKILLAAAFAAITTSGAAMAQSAHICAYVNDNVAGPNAVEGYRIGPGTATAHVGPYSTNGSGIGSGYYTGGLGAIRVKEGDLYVDDAHSESITHFTVNKADCTLTLDPTLYPSGDKGVYIGDGLAITPNGRTMFVGSTGDGHIYSHTIAANGSLGPAFTETSGLRLPVGIEVSSDGKTLVVAYPGNPQVCAFPISSGHLGTPNCQRTASFVTGVSIDPASACVYAAEGNTRTSEVAAFALTGGILGIPADNAFGPGVNANGILVNWDNKAIYVSNQYSAQVAMGTIASGCKLTYETIIPDGIASADYPGQIAQGKIAHGYVVTGDYSNKGTPSMGIFRVNANGKLTPIGSGQFPLMNGNVAPLTAVVIGVE